MRLVLVTNLVWQSGRLIHKADKDETLLWLRQVVTNNLHILWAVSLLLITNLSQHSGKSAVEPSHILCRTPHRQASHPGQTDPGTCIWKKNAAIAQHKEAHFLDGDEWILCKPLLGRR